MMNKGRSSGQDNAFREGVGLALTMAQSPDSEGRASEKGGWPHCSAVANENDDFGRCLLPSGHDGQHLSEFGDAFTEGQASIPASTPVEQSDHPSSARTSAETPQADCPSSQSKDVT